MFKMIKLAIAKIKWKKKNKDNRTTISSPLSLKNVSVGRNTYGLINVEYYDKNGKLSIGHYCSIAKKSTFVLGGSHDYSRISLWPFQTMIYQQPPLKETKSFIVIEDDVWIGYDCLILSNVRIGRGSVIAARSIVTKDVPPYSVFIGNKVYKNRFNEEIIEKIKKIDYSKINHHKGDNYEKYCQEKVNDENIDFLISSFIEGDNKNE